MVKWSACSPSALTVQVRIPLKLTIFSVKFVLEKNENKQKEVGVGPFKKLCMAGSGCGSVGRAVASDTRGPQFESSHQKLFIQTM